MHSVLDLLPDQIVKIYVGCALTYAPVKFQRDVAALKEALRQRYVLLDFAGLSGGVSHEACRAVFDHDIGECVGRCQILVAICDFPSTGLGIEIWEAHRVRRIPTLLLAQENAKVTRLVLGIPDAPTLKMGRYGEFDQIPGLVDSFIRDMAAYLVPAYA